MRLIILFFFISISNQAFSQHLVGSVIDVVTRKPISNARISNSTNTTFTTSVGSFVLNNFHNGDTKHLTRLTNMKFYLILKNNIVILIGVILAITACKNEKNSQNNETDQKLKFSMYSKNVKDSFYISVQLPLEYKKQPKNKYPVLFLTDANFFSPMLSPILHQYEKGGLLPPLIMVSVGYKSFEIMDSLRVRDYMFPASIPSDEMKATGGGRKFYHFLTEELLPKIDSNYRTDTNKKTLLGHSFGGYFSLLALSEQIANKRNDFTGFISASPTLWYNDNYLFNLLKKLNDSDLKDSINVFLSVGAKEEPKWSIQPVKDFSKKLSDARLNKMKTRLEIYSHLDHMDVGIISFIKGLEQIYNKPLNN